jgi:hypothetical protein
MLGLVRISILASFALFPFVHPAVAQGCNTDGILGYPAEPNAAGCAQANGSLPPSPYAYTQRPPCDGDMAAMVGEAVRNYASQSAKEAAASYFGPVAGVIAGLVGNHQAGQLLGLLGAPSTSATCRALCVKIPRGRSVVEIRGMARTNESHGGNPTYCLPGHPSDCAIGWSYLYSPSRESTPAGEVICTVAANWSHNRGPEFSLFVYFD